MTGRVAAVFGSARVLAGDPEYGLAERTGTLLAEAGWTVMTGGYLGVMEAASRGARDAGGHVIGVTVAEWAETSRPNRWVVEERQAPDLIARLGVLVRADALIAVGGGIGTLTEVALSWNLLQKRHTGAPLILVGERWERVVSVIADELVVGPADLEQIRLVADAEGVLAALPD